MTRYLTFYGNAYYAAGGINDFIGDYDTIDQAKEAINKAHLKEHKDDIRWEWAWCHIWDKETRKIVFQINDD